MDFGCPNGAKLAPKWDQKSLFTWKGDFSKFVLWLQRGWSPEGTPSDGPMGYPALAFILGGFGVCVGVFWPHLGSSLEVVCLHVGTTPSPMGYPILGRFLNPIWCQLGAILGHFGARAGSGWAGGVTRSANN